MSRENAPQRTSLEFYVFERVGSLSDFADLIEVSRVTIYNWLKGKAKPTLKHIMKIHEVTEGVLDPTYMLIHFPQEIKNGS